jgi:uncharacterized protein (UPF0371 family)
MAKEKKVGFSTKKYLEFQKAAIKERLSKFPGKLYLEFGGKLIDDYHAVRTLPGYDPNAKLELLLSLKKDLEIIYCISAKQLQQRKIRGDLNLTYDLATLKAIADLKKYKLPLHSVVINRYEGEAEAIIFKKRLERNNKKVFLRKEIKNYPNNISYILSKRGYGGDHYLKTSKSLVVVWGAGPGAGKLSTCLGQVFLDQQHGINSGYAKFETFPIWDLPLNHAVNVAYEAATADLGDFNLIDPHHFKHYHKKSVNYNRDVEAFPIISKLVKKVVPKDNFMHNYFSPTDMGINLANKGIVDDKIVSQAAKMEIIFYLFRYRAEYAKGILDKEVLDRMEKIMSRLNLRETDLETVSAARDAAQQAMEEKGKGEKGIFCGSAIQLSDGRIVYGKNSSLLHAEAAAMLNAIKVLAKIPDSVNLISKEVIQRINLQKDLIGEERKSLTTAETLLALAISSISNPLAKKAQTELKYFRHCYLHSTHSLSQSDEVIFRKLGMWVTTDAKEKDI